MWKLVWLSRDFTPLIDFPILRSFKAILEKEKKKALTQILV